MGWDIGLSQDFDAWFRTLDGDDQEAVVNAVEQVKLLGTNLDASPLIEQTAEPQARNRRELRVAGNRLRVAFTLDRSRLLIQLHAGSVTP